MSHGFVPERAQQSEGHRIRIEAVILTYHVPCLQSHFKGFHLAIARLPDLFLRLLRVEVKKTFLGSRKERTHLLNYHCCFNSARMKSRPKIKISYSLVRAELSATERHLFLVIIKSVILFV